MKTKSYLLLAASLITLGLSASGATYSGNGNTGFGGPIGLGSLQLTDNGTTVSGQFNRGANGFNDVLVIYIDSVTGGFSSTAGFGDNADGLRRAISGIDSGSNRSTMGFGGGFLPDYAIALGPSSDNFGGLWHLADGGANSLGYINSVNLSPTGDNSASAYTFSFNLSDIGIIPDSGSTFNLFGTYISNSGYRSDEAVAGNAAGTQGWNPFEQTAFGAYTVVPEPSTFTLLGCGLVAAMVWRRRQ